MAMGELVLEGIEGISPLGFLTALGTLVTLDDKWPGQVHMSWLKSSGYYPIVKFPGRDAERTLEKTQDDIAKVISETMCVPSPEISEADSKEVKTLFKQFGMAAKDLGKAEETLQKERQKLKKDGRKQGMQGEILENWINEQTKELREKIREQRDDVQKKRRAWLDKRCIIVPAQELRLGKTLKITSSEYRDSVVDALQSCGNNRQRRVVDFLSAFASETVVSKGKVEATPFCFTNGSGRQYFLETICDLMRLVDAKRIKGCLFSPWTFDDQGYSLRWAPLEDRRYALMWDDPTGQTVRALWAANLVAYNGLRLLPVADLGGRLGTSGFSGFGDGPRFFSWPIWEGFLCVDTLRSLLSLDLLREPLPNWTTLERMGVVEVFRCERILVGEPPNAKRNFSIPFPAGTREEAWE
jgi:hypothetical protein